MEVPQNEVFQCFDEILNGRVSILENLSLEKLNGYLRDLVRRDQYAQVAFVTSIADDDESF